MKYTNLTPSLDPGTIGFDLSLEAYLNVVSKVGFHTIEFALPYLKSYVEERSHKELKQLLNLYEVEIAQGTCGFGIPSNIAISKESFGKSLVTWEENCIFAGSIGINQVSVIINPTKGNGIDKSGVQLEREEIIYRLNSLANIANKYQLKVAVEFIDDRFISEQLNIIRIIGKSNLGLLVDTYILGNQSDPISLIKSIPPEYIYWIHLSDSKERQNSDWLISHKPQRVLPGSGYIDLAKMLSTITDNGYNGVVSLEVYGNEFLESLSVSERAKRASNSIFRGPLASFFKTN
ncbi:sugar phosphate isomerase/epimerase [Bacillus sp. A116_S68]|jgi:sugar phosphate isomerase/epimerase|nr:sugar phosphate isomerase/epimerase [Bacillus sp. A116_S68]